MPAFAAALGVEEPACADQLVTIEAAYRGEIWRNLRGGIRRDSVYLDNADLVATIDAEKIGFPDTTVRASALYNNRNTFSEPIVGDLQTISNIDTDGSLRLYEAWIERSFGSARFKAGLIDLNREFDVNNPGSLFINSSHGIGPDFSQVGETGPSIFPLTGLGVVAHADLGHGMALRVGLFEGTPGDPDRPRRTAFDLDADEGALLVGEVSHRFHKRGRIALGGWRHTGGRVAPIDPARSSAASPGAYLHLETPIAEAGGIEIDGFARVGFADPGIHQIARYTGAGITLSGPMLAKDGQDEQIGIALAIARNGDAFRRARAAAGEVVEDAEAVIELTYRIQITDYLTLQPDIQYVLNPGTKPDLDNAIAAGLRFELSWRSGE